MIGSGSYKIASLLKLYYGQMDKSFAKMNFHSAGTGNDKVFVRSKQEYISEIYNINIVVIDKRIYKDKKELYRYIKTRQVSIYYIIIYKTIVFNTVIFYIVQYKNRIILKVNDFPDKFINLLKKKNNGNNK
jgi:hypothetical protein